MRATKVRPVKGEMSLVSGEPRPFCCIGADHGDDEVRSEVMVTVYFDEIAVATLDLCGPCGDRVLGRKAFSLVTQRDHWPRLSFL